MKRMPQIIDHPHALQSLSVLPGKRLPGAGRIEVRAEGVDKDTIADWSKDLNRKYYACGCAEGSIGLLVGLAAAGVAFAFGATQGWGNFGLIGMPVIGLAGGKLTGLFRAEVRLKAVVANISQTWGKVAATKPDDWACG
jgi:hypothetical protein